MTQSRTKREWRTPGRRQGYRVLAPERHLIVCEGEKTEPFYFKGMRDALKPEFRNRIHIVVKGTGLHTVDLFDYALRESRLSGGYDHVWLAYDRDDFDLREFDSVAGKCAQSSDETTAFHALWSNPCFEVWMLLHFGYTTAEMTSAEALAKTDAAFRRELNRPYSKTAMDLFEELRSRMHPAEANAERLMKWHKEQGVALPSGMNPCTAMPELITMLSDYIGGDKQYV
mgnify:CR=1 FL=1